MKMSSKLLVGLFGLIVLSMIIFNFSLTKEIKSTLDLNNKTVTLPSSPPLLIDVDSAQISK